MAAMKYSCILLLQTLLLSNVFAQFQIQNLPYASQIKNVPYNQPYSQPPLVNSLLSTYKSGMPFVDKLGAIASVIQKLPPKNPGVANRRHYMAEALKKTALESLMFAANACKCSRKPGNGLPLPKPQLTVGNDVIGNRAANFRYDRFV